MSPFPGFDEDALLATADLVRRTGATEFNFGYVREEGEPDFDKLGSGWYASANYRGTLIKVDEYKDPILAADALARRLLTGARCKCGKLVALSDAGAVSFPDVEMADGTMWTTEEQLVAGQCRWTRMGRRWQRGCEPVPE